MPDVKAQTGSQSAGNKYDEMPYLSKAFYHTNPEHFHSLAKFFGMNPPALENARVLDMGGGTGANLYSFALNYPKSKILCVDLSEKEVQEGNKHIEALGLKNYDLKAMSIMDIDESYGKFDYIICHGVFSWVPKEVQDKILEIIGKQLTPNGVAEVSYNTLPGWNSINAIRHMIQFHSRYFNTTEDKVLQSKALMNFVKDVMKEDESAHAQSILNECQIIEESDDSFLFHEYITEGNTEFYFTDFVEKASAYGLKYLADCTLPAMSTLNLPNKAAAKLSELTDIVKQEQYMDFVFNRRFRNTLLCSSSAEIERNLGPKSLEGSYFHMITSTNTSVADVDFSFGDLKVEFTLGQDEVNCVASNPLIIAALFAFASNPAANWTLDEIKSFIKSNCKNLEIPSNADDIILHDFINMIMKGVMNFRSCKPHYISVVTDQPKLSDLALYQLSAGFPFVFNQNNETVTLDSWDAFLFSNMNGKNKVEDLTKLLDKKLEDSGQFLEIEGKRVTDQKLKSKLLGEMVFKALHFAKGCGLLVG